MSNHDLKRKADAVKFAREVLNPDVPEDKRYLANLESCLEFDQQQALRDLEPKGRGN